LICVRIVLISSNVLDSPINILGTCTKNWHKLIIVKWE